MRVRCCSGMRFRFGRRCSRRWGVSSGTRVRRHFERNLRGLDDLNLMLKKVDINVGRKYLDPWRCPPFRGHRLIHPLSPDAASLHRLQRLFVSTHHWRIAMTSLVRNKLFDRQLFILTAGLLLQAHSVFASDSIGDAQAQARALLDPPVVSRVMSADAFPATQANGHVASRPDPQEQARALLLGKPEEG